MALTSAAFAADLPTNAPPPVYLPPPLIYTWTGIYIGINAGYHWGGSATQFGGTDTGVGGPGTLLALGGLPGSGVSGADQGTESRLTAEGTEDLQEVLWVP